MKKIMLSIRPLSFILYLIRLLIFYILLLIESKILLCDWLKLPLSSPYVGSIIKDNINPKLLNLDIFLN